MFGSTTPEGHGNRPWHAQAGDLLGDNYNVPGLILCALGIVAMACTLTAAGYGFGEWVQIGAIATAALWILGVGALLVEHRREEVIELKYGRQGHAPGTRRPVRYSAAPRPAETDLAQGG
ncbi:hypothetical protein F5X71_18490 [Nocardia brasiliensis]|uniref:UsfY protein n=1 Tax=Nocardia brasiliensis TaxID=37326 RepID=A0A6G9XT72_NOCBR|nr:hypothetical protein [Nocardia brasiliensis]QIS04050.1 hypothetical protein F5X71_18490 [Nocardia brasiliensis]